MSKSWAMRAAVLGGGLVGSVARHAIQSGADDGAVPWGTLSVNLAGAFLLGVLTGRVARFRKAELAAAFLGVGALGAFTTFSALVGQLEAIPVSRALAYASMSVVLGLAAAVSGLRLGQDAGMRLVWVGVLGSVGAPARYELSRAIHHRTERGGVATMDVNVIGTIQLQFWRGVLLAWCRSSAPKPGNGQRLD